MAKKKEAVEQQKQQKQSNFTPDKAADKLRETLAQLSEKMGFAVESLSESTFVPEFLDTGNYALNWSICNDMLKGGLPLTKVISWYGDPGVGKTLLLALNLGNMIRRGGVSILVDTEDANNSEFVKMINNDWGGEIVKRIQRAPDIDTLEDLKHWLSNLADALIAKNNTIPVMVGIDSISQLTSKKEMEDASSGSETRDMTKAQLMRGIYRVMNRKFRIANITLIGLEHTSASIGGYGNPVTSAGHGAGGKFAGSLILWITSGKTITNDKGIPVGVKLRVKIAKNRMTFKDRFVNITVNFKSGVDRLSGLCEILKQYEVIGASAREMTPNTKLFLPDPDTGASFEMIKVPKKQATEEKIEELKAQGYTIEEQEKGGVHAMRGDVVLYRDLRNWLAEKGEERVIKQWNDALNAKFDEAIKDIDEIELTQDSVGQEDTNASED